MTGSLDIFKYNRFPALGILSLSVELTKMNAKLKWREPHAVDRLRQMTMQAAKSKSLPFMPQPPALDGTMAGKQAILLHPFRYTYLIPFEARLLKQWNVKSGDCQMTSAQYHTILVYTLPISIRLLTTVCFSWNR